MVVTWYHRQFKEAANERYLSSKEERVRIFSVPYLLSHKRSYCGELIAPRVLGKLEQILGVHDLWNGLRSAARFSENFSLLIAKTCPRTFFYDKSWQKTTHFESFFVNFSRSHLCLRISADQGSLFREFWNQKPTLMGGTYPYLQRAMHLPHAPNRLLLPSHNLEYFHDFARTCVST